MAVCRIHYFLLFYVVSLIESKLNLSMALHKREESNEFCIRPLWTDVTVCHCFSWWSIALKKQRPEEATPWWRNALVKQCPDEAMPWWCKALMKQHLDEARRLDQARLDYKENLGMSFFSQEKNCSCTWKCLEQIGNCASSADQ